MGTWGPQRQGAPYPRFPYPQGSACVCVSLEWILCGYRDTLVCVNSQIRTNSRDAVPAHLFSFLLLISLLPQKHEHRTLAGKNALLNGWEHRIIFPSYPILVTDHRGIWTLTIIEFLAMRGFELGSPSPDTITFTTGFLLFAVLVIKIKQGKGTGYRKNILSIIEIKDMRHLQFFTAFFWGTWTGRVSSFISGALRIKLPFSQATETRTIRGSCRAVTMCPFSWITSQNLCFTQRGFLVLYTSYPAWKCLTRVLEENDIPHGGQSAKFSMRFTMLHKQPLAFRVNPCSKSKTKEMPLLWSRCPEWLWRGAGGAT